MPNVQFSEVPCSEKAYSRRESWTPAGLTCSIELYISWADRYSFIDDLARNWQNRAWPYLTVAADPFMSQLKPVPVEISISPFNNAKYNEGFQGIDYYAGIATVNYRTWAPVRETIEFQTQAIRLEPKLFKWKENTAFPAEEALTIGVLEGLSQRVDRVILNREVSYANLQLPYNFYGNEGTDPPLPPLPPAPSTAQNVNANAGWVGTVHSKSYTSSLVADDANGTPQLVRFKEGTMLLLDPVFQDGVVIARAPSVRGGKIGWQRGYSHKFRWLIRPEGHNVFWRPQREVANAINGGGAGQIQNLVGGWNEVILKSNNKEYVPFPELDQTELLYTAQLEPAEAMAVQADPTKVFDVSVCNDFGAP